MTKLVFPNDALRSPSPLSLPSLFLPPLLPFNRKERGTILIRDWDGVENSGCHQIGHPVCTMHNVHTLVSRHVRHPKPYSTFSTPHMMRAGFASGPQFERASGGARVSEMEMITRSRGFGGSKMDSSRPSLPPSFIVDVLVELGTNRVSGMIRQRLGQCTEPSY